jgi:hypothetical protein
VPQLSPVRLTVGPAADLRAQLDYREDLVAERTALVNRVHADLSGLRPGYQHQIQSLTTRSGVHVTLTLIATDDTVQAGCAAAGLLFASAIDHTNHPATYPRHQPGGTYSETRAP